ncbi:unnamed protein product, partial [marine sediment metagenome]
DGSSTAEIEQHYRDKGKKSSLIDGAYEAEDFFPGLGEDGRWLHFMASPIKDNEGEIIGAIETLRDVTEQKRLEDKARLYVHQITRAQEEERERYIPVSDFVLLIDGKCRYRGTINNSDDHPLCSLLLSQPKFCFRQLLSPLRVHRQG